MNMNKDFILQNYVHRYPITSLVPLILWVVKFVNSKETLRS